MTSLLVEDHMAKENAMYKVLMISRERETRRGSEKSAKEL